MYASAPSSAVIADALRQLVDAESADARAGALAHARQILAAYDAPRNRRPLLDPVADVLLERVRAGEAQSGVRALADEVFDTHRHRLPLGTSADDLLSAAADRARLQSASASV